MRLAHTQSHELVRRKRRCAWASTVKPRCVASGMSCPLAWSWWQRCLSRVAPAGNYLMEIDHVCLARHQHGASEVRCVLFVRVGKSVRLTTSSACQRCSARESDMAQRWLLSVTEIGRGLLLDSLCVQQGLHAQKAIRLGRPIGQHYSNGAVSRMCCSIDFF